MFQGAPSTFIDCCIKNDWQLVCWNNELISKSIHSLGKRAFALDKSIDLNENGLKVCGIVVGRPGTE